MFPRAAIIVALGLLALSLAQRGTAQTEATSTTMGGVYTTVQAARGEEQYFSLCVACHPVAMHTGVAFTGRWTGLPLSDLFDAIKDKMPKNDPGSLTPEESAQLIAYILKLNEVPTGKTDLPADAETLKKIRIETPSTPPGKIDGDSFSPFLLFGF